ncbi:unnamed protein product [Citrullus colocynthis]|uniref:Uncharacterized protein n=1 Tax=Citrullus colocynthis TaxID=252529 RepID=A0ABP0XV08_9ROSI
MVPIHIWLPEVHVEAPTVSQVEDIVFAPVSSSSISKSFKVRKVLLARSEYHF